MQYGRHAVPLHIGVHWETLPSKVDHVCVQHRLILCSSHVLYQRIDCCIVEDRSDVILWPTGDEDDAT